jgi:nitrite reductase/ring-hydroxylating ferredoxin subunit
MELRVGRVGDLPRGSGMAVYARGCDIAVFRVGDEILAIGNECPHAAGSLAEGQLEGEIVTCPQHGWEFDVRSGACMTVPGESVPRYPVRLVGDEILIDFVE